MSVKLTALFVAACTAVLSGLAATPSGAARPDMTSPVVPPPPAAQLPAMLHVAGNQLATADGRPIWLQGLCVDSLEWSATGERVVQSVEVGLDAWKANVIRLPVDMKADYWFGAGPGQKDGGAGYRRIVDSVVNAAAARGAYVAIDLHKFRAPQAADLAFWKDVATRYKNHPAVLFELFNEPHDITWPVWRDGGEVTDQVKPKEGVVVENTEKLAAFHAVGLQQLVDAIRAAGAKNLIIAGGIDWSFDLSGVIHGYALDDRGGNGIMYSAHVYPWKKGWREHFLATAEKYPIFVGEVGAIRAWSDFPFIGPAERYPLDGWAEDMIAVIQKYRLNWTGFSFNPHCGPKVISDWNYTPTPYWGTYVQQALAGRRFELKAMR